MATRLPSSLRAATCSPCEQHAPAPGTLWGSCGEMPLEVTSSASQRLSWQLLLSGPRHRPQGVHTLRMLTSAGAAWQATGRLAPGDGCRRHPAANLVAWLCRSLPHCARPSRAATLRGQRLDPARPCTAQARTWHWGWARAPCTGPPASPARTPQAGAGRGRPRAAARSSAAAARRSAWPAACLPARACPSAAGSSLSMRWRRAAKLTAEAPTSGSKGFPCRLACLLTGQLPRLLSQQPARHTCSIALLCTPAHACKGLGSKTPADSCTSPSASGSASCSPGRRQQVHLEAPSHRVPQAALSRPCRQP